MDQSNQIFQNLKDVRLRIIFGPINDSNMDRNYQI